jgi:iron(III) transport system substrate-binding protein
MSARWGLPLACVSLLVLAASPLLAADRPWMSDASLVAAAKKEGSVTFYSSTNEDEQLPELKLFEEATGIKGDYIRGGDAQLMARIMTENAAGRQLWDLINIPEVESMQKPFMLAYAPPEAAALSPQARDPENRWFGIYTIYHAPAFNTTKVKAENLPQRYEDFLKHPEWAGHVAIESTDRDWLFGIVNAYGAERGKKLIQDIVTTLQPIVHRGHLAMARALGSGEYWVTLNNFVNLTLNVKMGNAPVDYWITEPVIVTYGQIGINAKAPHPNAAKLLANFLLSAEAQTLRTKWGRIPTRPDVQSNPPGIVAQFEAKKPMRAALTAEQDSAWQKSFNEWFKVR